MEDTTSRDQRKFSQEQYEMLWRCSDKEDMTEWNNWRQENPEEEVFLEGANLISAHLEGANLISTLKCLIACGHLVTRFMPPVYPCHGARIVPD